MGATARVLDPVLADGDVVDFLQAHHHRTRVLLFDVLDLVRRGGTDEEISGIAAAAHVHFTYWSPLHEVDEEQSVAPAVAAFGPRDTVEAVLDMMTRDHVHLDRIRETISPPWRELALAPERLEALRPEIIRKTSNLARTMMAHWAQEERVFFPLVRLYVPAREQAKMLTVMRERRGGVFESWPPV